MKQNLLLFVFFSYLSFSLSQQEQAPTLQKNDIYLFDSLCNPDNVRTIDLYRSRSLILKSNHNLFLPRDSPSCEVVLKPKERSSLVLSIKSYNLSSNEQLTIEDLDYFKVQLLGRREFSDERKYFFSEGRFSIRYTRDPYNLQPKTAFEFVVTQTHDGPCKFDEFKCGNKLCIDSSLKCDGHNNCGDRSDEKQCRTSKIKYEVVTDDYEIIVDKRPVRFSIMGIIVSVGSILLIIVIIIIVSIVIVKRRREAKKDPNAQSSVPTVAAAIPPPSASQVPQETYWNRFRNSFRSNEQRRPSATSSEERQASSDNYQVPSMYPTAPELSGVDNPDFKDVEA